MFKDLIFIFSIASSVVGELSDKISNKKLIKLTLKGNGYVIASVTSNKKLRNWFGIHVLSVAVINLLVGGFLKPTLYIIMVRTALQLSRSITKVTYYSVV